MTVDTQNTSIAMGQSKNTLLKYWDIVAQNMSFAGVGR